MAVESELLPVSRGLTLAVVTAHALGVVADRPGGGLGLSLNATPSSK